MKNLIIILSVLFLFSCQKKQEEINRLQEINDSLMIVSGQQDKIVIDYVQAFNDIQENLEQIKKTENIITLSTTNQDEELDAEQKDIIMEDITLINDLMQENKRKIDELERKLRATGKKNTELEKMIVFLNEQITAKDAELASLNAKLSALNLEVEHLAARVDTLETVSTEKSKIIESQDIALNTAFYVFGTEKELRAQNILTKEGGFMGFGKSMTLKQDFNVDYFTKIDIRELKEVSLQVSKARLITTHPSDSYKFVGEKPVQKLVITDFKKFWKNSKYCVVVVE
ncbi:hypothetical protein ACFLRI_00680 [Bacteroidota bacterium]